MKIACIFCLILAIVLVVLNHSAEYWLGYSESQRALLAADPIIGLMLESALFLILFILALSTIFLKKHRLWLLSTVAIFWPLVILTVMLTRHVLEPGGSLIMRGLHDRVMHDYTLADLRHFAKDVNEAGLIKIDWINHGDVSAMGDAQKKTFAQLRKKYPFMIWMDDGRILHGPSLLNYGQEGVVDFEWGGALTGHWGCSISIDGSKNDPSLLNPAFVIRVSDDIYFFFD